MLPNKPYLITSAIPAENSRIGKVSNVSMSIITAWGWWNAPIIFLPKV